MPAKVLLGNWHEELAYEADKKALQRNLKESGGLLSQRILAKVNHHRTPCSLPPVAADGYLRFNTPLMIQNMETLGCLSVDTDDQASSALGPKIHCTTVPSPDGATLRSTWILVPVPSADDAYWKSKGEEAVVHYGQKFVIQCLPDLSAQPLFLTSERKSPNSSSKVSQNQEVYFSANGGQAAFWSLEFGNAEYRPDMEGQPAKASSVALFRHTTTNMPLASSSKFHFTNDFGAENEVCCCKFQQYFSKGGRAPEQKSNFWVIVSGQ
jgi:hypothetical protein